MQLTYQWHIHIALFRNGAVLFHALQHPQRIPNLLRALLLKPGINTMLVSCRYESPDDIKNNCTKHATK